MTENFLERMTGVGIGAFIAASIFNAVVPVGEIAITDYFFIALLLAISVYYYIKLSGLLNEKKHITKTDSFLLGTVYGWTISIVFSIAQTIFSGA